MFKQVGSGNAGSVTDEFTMDDSGNELRLAYASVIFTVAKLQL